MEKKKNNKHNSDDFRAGAVTFGVGFLLIVILFAVIILAEGFSFRKQAIVPDKVECMEYTPDGRCVPYRNDMQRLGLYPKI